jgi:hypothetical protein
LAHEFERLAFLKYAFNALGGFFLNNARSIERSIRLTLENHKKNSLPLDFPAGAPVTAVDSSAFPLRQSKILLASVLIVSQHHSIPDFQ